MKNHYNLSLLMFVKRLILPILVLGFGNLLWSQNATQVPVVEPSYGADKQGSPQEEEAHEKMSISNTLWIEEMTWLEIRDTIKKGTNRIIVGTGGLEQNGPFLANGKHNYQLQAMLPEIAKRIGNCLIAPIVKFVPEGEMYPKATGHMGYPGSVSLREETFKMLLKDICMSYQFSGFDTMILVGSVSQKFIDLNRIYFVFGACLASFIWFFSTMLLLYYFPRLA